jgi:transketolase
MELVGQDDRIMLLTGDLGFGVLTPFARAYPKNFLNVGVAEQNMTGVAVGLAREGRIVFTYSIANFNTLRCLEQIRNDACYHKANVKVISVGGGFCYGALGRSHPATEDLAIMRAIPGLTVVAPGDPVETDALVRAAWETEGPFYVRLGRGGESTVHGAGDAVSLGRAAHLRDGTDMAIISAGGMLPNAMAAAALLEKDGIRASVTSMHTVKPLDEAAVAALARKYRLLVTVEEHIARGGLGGAVAEVVAGMVDARSRVVRIGLGENFCDAIGNQDYLRRVHGLSPEGIAEQSAAAFKETRHGL